MFCSVCGKFKNIEFPMCDDCQNEYDLYLENIWLGMMLDGWEIPEDFALTAA